MPRMIEAAVVKSGTITRRSTSVVASATRYPGGTRRVYRKAQDWQAEAWRFYDTCGELRFAANWIGNVMSRASLYAATREPDYTLTKQETGPAVDAMVDLFDGEDGQAQMLSAIGIHLTIPGECYLVGRAPVPDRDEAPDEDIWEIVGTEEMKHTGDRWGIDYQDGNRILWLDDSAVVIRIWRPHPRRRIEADSPVRALLGTLAELEFLSRHVMAQATSRLAGAGVLVLPQGMTFPAPPENSGLPENATDADIFMSVLGESMISPIHDPGSAAAVVPVVITAPDDVVDKINYLTFWTELDQHAVELRTEAIRRLALGLDMPPEIVLGTATSGSSANHWTAWQIEESSIKATIEPLLELVVNALSVGYLQPITDNPSDAVGYDTSQLRLRPNRSKEAIELYDRGELDGEALRRETGFSEDDAPDAEEFKAWMLKKVASGSTTPEQVADALVALGIMQIRDTAESPPTQERPAPSLRDHPQTGPPEPDTQVASLEAVGDALVFRALERAGNRLRSMKQIRPACAAADTYLFVDTKPGDLDRVMEDAWTCIPRVLSRLTPLQQQVVEHALDTYTRNLLLTKADHDRDVMMRHLMSTPMRQLPS
jgi:hypothetical protein